MTMPKGYEHLEKQKCDWCGKETKVNYFPTGKAICIDCFSLMGIS